MKTIKCECRSFNDYNVYGNIILEMFYDAIISSRLDKEKAILEVEDYPINKEWTPYNYIFQRHHVNTKDDIITSEFFKYILYWKDEQGFDRPQTIRFSIKEVK